MPSLLVDKEAEHPVWLEGDEAEAATPSNNRPHGTKEEALVELCGSQLLLPSLQVANQRSPMKS